MTAILQTSTGNLAQSLAFYTQLDFKVISKEKPTIVSDGKILLEINPDKYARAGVKLYQKDWSMEVKELNKITKVIKLENGYLLGEGNGVWIYLIEEEIDFSSKILDIEPSLLGNCAGLSIEVIDFQAAIKLWQTLGLKITMGSEKDGWIVLANKEDFGVSLMKPLQCPHQFFNPSLSYFNGKNNLSIIQKIRDLSIPITEEITTFNKEGIVDNIILRDPSGFGFFIFSD